MRPWASDREDGIVLPEQHRKSRNAESNNILFRTLMEMITAILIIIKKVLFLALKKHNFALKKK